MREERLEADNKMAKIQKVMLTMLRDDFLSVLLAVVAVGPLSQVAVVTLILNYT